MSMLLYGREPDYRAFGRNGKLRQIGIDASSIGREVALRPVNSQGRISFASLLLIPIEDARAVARAILDAADEAERQAAA